METLKEFKQDNLETFNSSFFQIASSSDYGVPVSCVGLNGQNHLVESLCGSGGGLDCNGHSHEAKCCVGHLAGRNENILSD